MICTISKWIPTIYNFYNVNIINIVFPKIYQRKIFKKDCNTKNIVFCTNVIRIVIVIKTQIENTFNFKKIYIDIVLIICFLREQKQ